MGKLLSDPLRYALELQVYVPHITTHRVSRSLCRKEDTSAMHVICRDALSTISFAAEDVVFCAGELARRMLFVIDGKLEYRKSGTQIRSIVSVANSMMCEAGLWTEWVH